MRHAHKTDPDSSIEQCLRETFSLCVLGGTLLLLQEFTLECNVIVRRPAFTRSVATERRPIYHGSVYGREYIHLARTRYLPFSFERIYAAFSL